MSESFEKHFVQKSEREKSPEEIKEEKALKLIEEIKKIKEEMKEKGETIEGYQKIIELTKEIKALYEERERKFKNGELICHYEGEWDYWDSHPQGVIIRKDNDWFIYTGEEE